jgi:hypothetical protein
MKRSRIIDTGNTGAIHNAICARTIRAVSLAVLNRRGSASRRIHMTSAAMHGIVSPAGCSRYFPP